MNAKVKILLILDRKVVSDWLVLFDELTNILFFLTQSLYDSQTPIEYFHRELEGKLYRFGMANHSIIQSIRGIEFDLLNLDKKRKEVDFFSMYGIIRQQIESFINTYYLVFDDVSSERKNLRYDVYKLHGLNRQNRMSVTTEHGSALKQKVLSEIAKTKASIQENPIFKSSDAKEKGKFLAPRYPKLVKSEDLFGTSDITKLRLREMWNLYSNYAHAEHISDRQYHASKNDQSGKFLHSNIISSITQLSYLTTKLINYMRTTFQSAESVFQSLDEYKRAQVEVWDDLMNKRN